MQITETIKQVGEVEVVLQYENGKEERRYIMNTVLDTAKQAQAKVITNNLDTTFDFYVNNMLFGTNGSVGGVPLTVETSRNGLFGPTLVNKTVIASLNPNSLTQAIFTAVVAYSEGNGNTINEMALQMKNGNLYSMVTMGGISKTSAIQLLINWRISMI